MNKYPFLDGLRSESVFSVRRIFQRTLKKMKRGSILCAGRRNIVFSITAFMINNYTLREVNCQLFYFDKMRRLFYKFVVDSAQRIFKIFNVNANDNVCFAGSLVDHANIYVSFRNGSEYSCGGTL